MHIFSGLDFHSGVSSVADLFHSVRAPSSGAKVAVLGATIIFSPQGGSRAVSRCGRGLKFTRDFVR